MKTKMKRLIWLAPVCVLTSIGISVLVVYGLNSMTGLKLNPSVAGALSGAICAAYIVMSQRCSRSGGAGDAA